MSRIDFRVDRHFFLLPVTWVGVVGLSIGVRSQTGVARSLGLLRFAIGDHRVQPARLRTRRVSMKKMLKCLLR